MHDLVADDDGRRLMNAISMDVFRVLDLDDLDPDACGQCRSLDDVDGAAALAATWSQNFDFHLDAFSFELTDYKHSTTHAMP